MVVVVVVVVVVAVELASDTFALVVLYVADIAEPRRLHESAAPASNAATVTRSTIFRIAVSRYVACYILRSRNRRARSPGD